MLFAFLVFGAVVSCKKNSEDLIAETNVTRSLDKLKFQKIEKFISVVWNIPINEIKYDEVNRKFLFNKNEIALEELENAYDLANEYKLNHEK